MHTNLIINRFLSVPMIRINDEKHIKSNVKSDVTISNFRLNLYLQTTPNTYPKPCTETM